MTEETGTMMTGVTEMIGIVMIEVIEMIEDQTETKMTEISTEKANGADNAHTTDAMTWMMIIILIKEGIQTRIDVDIVIDYKMFGFYI